MQVARGFAGGVSCLATFAIGVASVACSSSGASTPAGAGITNDGGAALDATTSPGSDGGSDSGSSPSGTSVDAGAGVQLTVHSASTFGSPASNGDVSIDVDLTLTNVGSESALLIASLFSIQTTDGVTYAGNANTTSYSRGCDSSASVTAGNAVDCVVVFAIPPSATAKELLYTTASGVTASVALTVGTCTNCGTSCVDTSTDPSNCGQCDNGAAAGTCSGGVFACPSGQAFCTGQCVTLTAGHMTTCESASPTSSCKDICGALSCTAATVEGSAGFGRSCGEPVTVGCDVSPGTVDAGATGTCENVLTCTCN